MDIFYRIIHIIQSWKICFDCIFQEFKPFCRVGGGVAKRAVAIVEGGVGKLCRTHRDKRTLHGGVQAFLHLFYAH